MKPVTFPELPVAVHVKVAFDIDDDKLIIACCSEQILGVPEVKMTFGTGFTVTI